MASGVDKRNLEHVIQLYQEHILKYGIGNNRFLEYRHFKSFMQERFNPDQLNLEISTDQSLWSQICFNTFKMNKSVMGVSRCFFLFVCLLFNPVLYDSFCNQNYRSECFLLSLHTYNEIQSNCGKNGGKVHSSVAP